MKKVANCVFTVVLASTLLAQNKPGGAIKGTVTDWDGVPIPKAEVQASSSSGQSFRTTTTVAGAYTLSELPPATYEVSIVARAMKPYRVQKIVVSNGLTVPLNARLEDFENLNTLGDGRDLIDSILSKTHPVPSGVTPRTISGKPDLNGVWYAQRIVNPGNPELTPWAAATTKERQANALRDFPSSRCLPNGIPLQGLFAPFRIVQTDSVLVLVYENDMPRQIYLDGRSQPKDRDPDFFGHSVGHWEGDELVVETVSFNGKTWIDIAGHPTTPKLHLTERYRRPDLGHLEVRIIIDDPDAYMKPWEIWKAADLAPVTEEVGQAICAENNQDVSHLAGQ